MVVFTTMVRFLNFAILLAIFSLSASQNSDDLEKFKQGFRDVLHTQNVKDDFLNLLKSYQVPQLLSEDAVDVYADPTPCLLCDLLIQVIVDERALGMSLDTITQTVTLICIDLMIQDERVCRGAVGFMVEVFIYAVDNYPDFTTDRICGVLLQSSGCPTGDSFEWSINIAPGSSPVRPQTNGTNQSFKILHFGDIHYDPDYVIGGNAACGEPLCCQPDQGTAPTIDDECGYWSDYRDADSPWHLVQEAVRQAKTQQVDFVYYTGDTVAHKVWDTSVEKNTAVLTQVYSYLNEQFDVPVFIVFGNHEPHPLNLWATDNIITNYTMDWIFDLSAQYWSDMIGQDVAATVHQGGCYSVSPRPGFRVIGINNNLAYIDNFWLFYDNVDPFKQLQWLADALKEAEDNNESVHILTHVPNAGSLLRVWNREFLRILDRFVNTITGIFNGHTHEDLFKVYYNISNSSQPIRVAVNAASVTPGSDSNPSFKYYDIDSITFDMIDYEEWYFNLTFVNSLGPAESIEWQKLYTFSEAYGAANLLPSEVDKIVYNMTQDHSLLDDYFKYKFRDSDVRTHCDDSCKKDLLCDIVTSSDDRERCDYYLGLYDQAK